MYMFRILNFGHCDLFGIWYLIFVISDLPGLGCKWYRVITERQTQTEKGRAKI